MAEDRTHRPGREAPDGVGEHTAPSQEDRLRSLEEQVTTLTAAVYALSSGLKNVSGAYSAHADEAARGARLAHEILFSKGM